MKTTTKSGAATTAGATRGIDQMLAERWEAHIDVPTAAIPGHVIKKKNMPYTPVACVPTGPGQIERARVMAASMRLLAAAKLFFAFYTDLSSSNPGFMGKLVLQDYATWNEALLELPAAIAEAEGHAISIPDDSDGNDMVYAGFDRLQSTERGRKVAGLLAMLLDQGAISLDRYGQEAVIDLLRAAWAGKAGTVISGLSEVAHG